MNCELVPRRDEYDMAAAHLIDRQLTTNGSSFVANHPYLQGGENRYLPTNPLDQHQLEEEDHLVPSTSASTVIPATSSAAAHGSSDARSDVTPAGALTESGSRRVAAAEKRMHLPAGTSTGMASSSSSAATSLAAFASDVSAGVDSLGSGGSFHLGGARELCGSGLQDGGACDGASPSTAQAGGYDQQREISEQIGEEFEPLKQTIERMQEDACSLQVLVRKVQRNEGVGLQGGNDAAEQCRRWASQMQDFLMVDGMPEVLLG